MTSSPAAWRKAAGSPQGQARGASPLPPVDGMPSPPRCLSLDLEVGGRDDRIQAIGAIRPDTGERLAARGSGLSAALEELDDLAAGATFVLGHNLIAFDLPRLAARKPELRLLRLPAVDTLRLSPLAFPRNPYHHLVKHYQDGDLRRGQRNDPQLDAGLTLQVFEDQQRALRKAETDLLTAWHWLTSAASGGQGFDDFFAGLRGSERPSKSEARAAIRRRLDGVACATHTHEVLVHASRPGWALAYALAWLSVAGENSVMPPWVTHQFPVAGQLVRRLRDTACASPNCDWCRERHDARKELARWFGFEDFRPEPSTDDERSMQQAIVEAAMAGNHVLGILPTGAGKSLCYQIPALSRYDKTGALTVVISPLVALMADQVAGMEARGIGCCIAINGLLSMPERADALDRVRLGDAGILIISPEQLRNRSLRRALSQHEIGAWVLDEAHCLSRWGHDFRPDYRYVARFIREKAKDGTVPPLLCLTATAKPDVEADLCWHFQKELGIALKVFNGGAHRGNLLFEVMKTSESEKFSHIHQVLMAYLPPESPGGAIVYCATRRQAEEVAEFLQLKEVAADHFHAGLPPETKKDVQQRFIGGELRVIAATKAFGMGIDKPDVRLVVHADIPGSLEDFMQEAGRAGRDREAARCVMFYAPEDVERQFGMSARSRLTRRDIHGILRALRNLNRKKRLRGEVIATSGEILLEDEERAFDRDDGTDDTRVRIAISWLEDAELLSREENLVQVFPSSLRVNSKEEARARLASKDIAETYRKSLLRIVEELIEADADEGITTDELMGVTGLTAEGVRGALHDLERLGIANNDTALTAFVHAGVERSSTYRLGKAEELEAALIDRMREAAPDQAKGEATALHLRVAAQELRDQGLLDPLPERLWRMLRSISYDGRGEGGAGGSLGVRRQDAETVWVTLRREWGKLDETAQIRREAAECLLKHLLACLPRRSRGTDLLAETTLGRLREALDTDIVLKGRIRNVEKLLERALLWLHEQEIIRLNKGLAVFRPAMTIRLEKERRGFAATDFKPLALHYEGQILQVHVMMEFAERGLGAMTDALRLAADYFELKQEEFLRRWLPDRETKTARQTTPESWRAIVEDLRNPVQQRIVTEDREQRNMLVLAGPGSGKTRALVHRIAYLVRGRRENPRGILALTYNRHAAVDVRRRLQDLIGADARGVTVLTCHALAMRLAGASFIKRADRPDSEEFRAVLRQAVDLLNGKGLPPDEADEWRGRLLAGFRWILVDEYQDIGPDEYALVSALAGRTLRDKEDKFTLFAVGDDDQNIYTFKGASVEFIRRFEEDYQANPVHLVRNYRSTRHIIAAANALIEPANCRMKAGYPIRIDKARGKEPAGGAWKDLDPVGKGRVQILPAGRDPVSQARFAMAELERLAALSPDWNWSRCAVIARRWEYLEPVRAYCELRDIPVQVGNENTPGFWRLREVRAFVNWLRERDPPFVKNTELSAWTGAQASGRWNDVLRQAIDEFTLESGSEETPANHLIEWLAEWGRDIRRRQHGLLLTTAHGAKGLEFDHVAVLDGGWERNGGHDFDPDEPRRLYYVAMTRARQTLLLTDFGKQSGLLGALRGNRSALIRASPEMPPAPAALDQRYMRLKLRDVDLSYAGRRSPRTQIHRAIAELSAGDPLEFRAEEPKNSKDRKLWFLVDRSGRRIGNLATNFAPPEGMRCRSALVHAIVTRFRDDSEPDYRSSLRSDTWETVVPELVFEPGEATLEGEQ